MATVALSAFAEPELELVPFLNSTKQHGFDAVELFRHRHSSSVVHDDLSVRAIRQHLQAAEIQLAAYEIRPLTGRKADSDERNLPYNLRQLEWDIHLGRALGIHTISVRGGHTTGAEQAAEARADLVEGLGQLIERIPDVTFAVGPAQDSPLQTAADFDELLDPMTEAGVILDVGPLRAGGVDLVAFARKWAGRVRILRLDDDDTPVEKIAEALVSGGFQGTVVLQSSAQDFRERVIAAF